MGPRDVSTRCGLEESEGRVNRPYATVHPVEAVVRWRCLSTRWLAAAICLLSFLQAPPSISAADDVFSIELGQVTVMPGETEAQIPVYLTNSAPVTSWEMGLDYDQFLAACTGIDLTGTLSEALNPSVTVSPSQGPIVWLRLEYPVQTPLPAGDEQLVAYLVFEIGSLSGTEEITILGMPSDISINGVSQATIGSGSLTVLVGNTVLIESGAGGPFSPWNTSTVQWIDAPPSGTLSPVRVPVLLWNDVPVTSFYLGLDYDEFLMCGVDFEGSITHSSSGGNFSVFATGSSGAVIGVDLLGGSQIEAGSAQLLCTLVLIPATPVAASYPVMPIPAFSVLNGQPVANLLGGEVTFLDEFLRGDASYNGKLSLSDATVILENLWLNVPLVCRAAADANNDGTLNVADPVYLLTFLFGSGPPPPPPFPAPGPDPSGTVQGLPCL